MTTHLQREIEDARAESARLAADAYTVRALRPQRRPFRWFVSIVVALVSIVLGSFGLRAYAADRYFDFQKSLARTCLDNGSTYAAGECMPVVVSCPGGTVETQPFTPYKVPAL